VIIGVIALLAWRIIDRGIDPKPVKTIMANDKLCEAYATQGKDLEIFYQEQNEYTQEEHNYGYFANGGTRIIPGAEQIQFVLRYNNSTLENTAKDKDLPAIPSRDEEVYDVTLTIMYDLTPENNEDNDGKTPDAVRYERVLPTGDSLAYQKTLYNYRKFVFDGIKLDENVLAIYADVYYVGDKNYEETPYGTLLLYYYEDEKIAYKLTNADIDVLTNDTK
jgi:hypothetical protein